MRAGEILALVYFVVVGGAALALLRRRAGAAIAIGWAVAGVLVSASRRGRAHCPARLVVDRRAAAGLLGAGAAGGDRKRATRTLVAVNRRHAWPDATRSSRARPAGVRLFPGLSDGAGRIARRHFQQPRNGSGILARAPCGGAAVLRAAAAAADATAARVSAAGGTSRQRLAALPTRQRRDSSRRSAMPGTHCRAAMRPVPPLLP